MVGSIIWLLLRLIANLSGNSLQTLHEWWFDNFHFLLVALPLLFGLAAVVHCGTRKRILFGVAFVVLIVAYALFELILQIANLGSPRYLKGTDPLCYPVEIWGAVVPQVMSTVIMLVFSLYTPGRQAPDSADTETR